MVIGSATSPLLRDLALLEGLSSYAFFFVTTYRRAGPGRGHPAGHDRDQHPAWVRVRRAGTTEYLDGVGWRGTSQRRDDGAQPVVASEDARAMRAGVSRSEVTGSPASRRISRWTARSPISCIGDRMVVRPMGSSAAIGTSL